jgi:meso-butanediol dehydrogenase / (S,S)-butanediol dehydrogenase / diacetyl reductase
MELQGKNAIVTGAARGIGRGIALELARAGCNLALVDIPSKGDPALAYQLAGATELEKVVGEARALGVKSVAVLADVTRWADCERMAREAADALGGVDVLCNNAGVVAVAPVAMMPEETWDRVLGVNAKGAFLCCKACIPYLGKNPEGAIVNISSVAGKTAHAGMSAYCASKFALIALTQSLAEELGPMNIRVNAVCPGFLHTAMWSDVLDKAVAGLYGVAESEGFETFVARNTFLGREQTPEDVGQAVVYLCRADNVTGIALNVAGGGEVH